jgi:hypothetical protein
MANRFVDAPENRFIIEREYRAGRMNELEYNSYRYGGNAPPPRPEPPDIQRIIEGRTRPERPAAAASPGILCPNCHRAMPGHASGLLGRMLARLARLLC